MWIRLITVSTFYCNIWAIIRKDKTFLSIVLFWNLNKYKYSRGTNLRIFKSIDSRQLLQWWTLRTRCLPSRSVLMILNFDFYLQDLEWAQFAVWDFVISKRKKQAAQRCQNESFKFAPEANWQSLKREISLWCVSSLLAILRNITPM